MGRCLLKEQVLYFSNRVRRRKLIVFVWRRAINGSFIQIQPRFVTFSNPQLNKVYHTFLKKKERAEKDRIMTSHVTSLRIKADLWKSVPAVFCKKKSQILHAEKANFAMFLHSLISFSAMQILQSHTHKALYFSNYM